MNAFHETDSSELAAHINEIRNGYMSRYTSQNYNVSSTFLGFHLFGGYYLFVLLVYTGHLHDNGKKTCHQV